MFPFNPSSSYYYPSQGSSMYQQATSGRPSPSPRFGTSAEPVALMSSASASYYSSGPYSSPASSNAYASSSSTGSAPTSSYNSECTCPYCIPAGQTAAGYPSRLPPGSPLSAPQPMYSHNQAYGGGYPSYPQQSMPSSSSYYSQSNVPSQASASPQQTPQQPAASSAQASGEKKRKKRSSSKDESLMSSSSSGSLRSVAASSIKEEYESDGFDDFGLDEDSEVKTEKDSGKDDESPEFNLDFHLSPESDGYRWRKYGRKTVKGSPYPRSYYKCTFPYCTVKKQVEAVFKEGKLASTNSIYKGEHNHERPCVTHVTATDQASFRNAVLSGFVRHEKMAARSNNTPRLVVSTTRTIDYLDDGYRWRKYGQKYVKGSGYPRSYYKCTEKSCTVKKQVDQLGGASSQALSVTYEGIHTHPPSLNKTNTRKRRRRSDAKEEPVKQEEEEEVEVPVKSEKTSDLHNLMLPSAASLASEGYPTHEFSVPAPRQQQSSYSSSGQSYRYQQPSSSNGSGWYGSTSTMPSRPAYYPGPDSNNYSSRMSSPSSKMPIYSREKDEFSFDRSSPGGGGIAVGGGGGAGGVAVAMPSHVHNMPFGSSSSPMVASPSPVATPASTSTPTVPTDFEPVQPAAWTMATRCGTADSLKICHTSAGLKTSASVLVPTEAVPHRCRFSKMIRHLRSTRVPLLAPRVRPCT